MSKRTPAGPRVQAVFDELLALARADPESHRLHALVYKAPARDFPKNRNYAYCQVEPVNSVYLIGTAPKMEVGGLNRIIALLAHEIAHALLLHRGLNDHSERDADELAEALFDIEIYYDSADIQTLDGYRGTRPRPDHLPR
jgi:hypothetical protein